MKTKKVLWSLVLMCCMTFVFAVACKTGEKKVSFDVAENTVWLDRYEEKDITLNKGEISNLTCVSNNEQIVTVENGRLIAQGEGKTTVVVSDGKASEKIEVRVNDSGVKPKIGFDEFNVYFNVPTEIPQYVNYVGKSMETKIDYSISFEDNSLMSVDGNMLTGIKIGETTATLTAEWKGLSLSKTVTVRVENSIYMRLDSSEITLYNIDAKLGRANTGVHVYEFGEELTDIDVSYTILSGDDCVRFENGMVYAKSEGRAEVEASYEKNGVVAKISFNVAVNPNYIETSFEKTSQPFDITWEQYAGTVGGRSDESMYAYRPADGVNSTTCWNNRVVSADISTKLMALYRQGYRYFAYDLYYTSNENLMVGCHNYTTWLSVGSYFRSDFLTIVADGEAINRLEKERWITLVYDFKGLWSQEINLPASFFFFVNDDTTTQYIMNARYYLDDSLLVDENLRYEDKGDYVQATNDEFDIKYPVSTGYKKGTDVPSIVVTENTVPTYGVSNKEIGGRMGVYKYTTKISAGNTNSLVVAKSMNISYDDGMYRMSQLGSYLAFDIYVAQEGKLTFRMNHLDTTATVVVDKTNLGLYEDWLIFIKDNKKQATLKIGEWYTVVVAFADNYDNKKSSAMISFSADEANMTVYVDNVRYYKTSDFIPKAYEDDKNAPYLTCESTVATVEKLSEGAFKSSYEYMNKTTESENSGVSFKGVTTSQNRADYFFEYGYKYVCFQMYIAENVSSVTLKAQAERNFKEYNVTIPVGADFGDLEVYVFNMDETTANSLERNKWYTVYLPVLYEDTDVGEVSVSVWSNGGSESAPAKMYMKYISFENAVTEATLGVHTNYTGAVSIEYQTSGNFAGAYKYTNANGGRYGTGAITYGESGVFFNEVWTGGTATTNQAWRFFTRGYKYVKLEMYIDKSVKTIDFRNGDNSMTAGWQTVDIGQDDNINNTVNSWNTDVWKFYDPYGNRVTSLDYDTWYTVYLTPLQTIACIQANGDGAPVMYFKNVEYLKELTLPFVPTLGVHTNYTSSVSIDYQTSGDFAGAYKYTNGNGGRYATNGATYGNSGVFFSEVWTGGTSAANQTWKFFTEEYQYVKFEMYIDESVTTIDFRVGDSGTSKSWHTVDIGEDDNINYTVNSWDSDVWVFYNASGNRVLSLDYNTWYTVYLKPSQTIACIQANGVNSVMYFRNMEYLKESI